MGFKKILITIVSVLTFAIVPGVLSACARSATPEPETETGPKYVAHRGYSNSYVANTEEAFRAAAGMGFYGIETDIRKTKDGYFVCNHDASVIYADGSEKKISATKRDALLSKPLKNDKTENDVYLCTFEKYLQACKAGGKVAVIELKDFFDAATIEEILDIVDNEYDRRHVSFISFIYYPLTLIKEEDPSLDVQYLSQTENDGVFESCLRDGISIDVKQTILTADLVKTFHDAGLTVNVWTVNDEAFHELACSLGVDYITTDIFSEDSD